MRKMDLMTHADSKGTDQTAYPSVQPSGPLLCLTDFWNTVGLRVGIR